MASKPTTPPEEARTRNRLLERLKTSGPADADTLAAEFGVTAMAVRQHLYALEAEGLVANEPQARPIGRPAKLWRLTRAADRGFPDSHAELTVGLLKAVESTFGEKGVEKLLETRRKQVVEQYRKQLPKSGSLRERVKALAELRSAEGYLAGLETGADGELVLVENHCPVCTAAAACLGLCGIELEIFRELLGPRVSVERTEHIQNGARRCAYSIIPKR